MALTVNELLDIMQDLADGGQGTDEVRLAFQPSWPLQFGLDYQVVNSKYDKASEPECPDCGGAWNELECSECKYARYDDTDDAGVVYLAQADHSKDSPYLPGWASQALGWT